MYHRFRDKPCGAKLVRKQVLSCANACFRPFFGKKEAPEKDSGASRT
jgi:hypothetical protein